MGLTLRGNIGRRVSELETDNNFIYLNGLLGLTSDINFAANGGGGITHSFTNGLLFGSGDSPISTFSVTSDTQTCDEQGGSDTHFFLNVLAGTTLVYLEYNVTGEWESGLAPYNVAEGENDLLFAIDGTPPSDIDVLIRFVDVDNELTSEIYNWTLLSCQAGEVLSINSVTQNGNTIEVGVDLVSVYQYDIGLLNLRVEISFDDISWVYYVIPYTPHLGLGVGLNTSPQTGSHLTTIVGGILSSGTYLRLTGKDAIGNEIVSNSVQYI